MATLSGKAEVAAFLTEASRQMIGFKVKQQIVDGDHACALFQFTAAGTVIEGCDYFRVANGGIAEIRAFFDPRPILG